MFDPLRYFLLVVEHGTLTSAARRAHVTQPALTASIHKLESELGARLFHRGHMGASLTAAGEALLPRARAALAAVEDGRRAVAEIAGLDAGTVRLGGGATVCTYYLPTILTRFRAAYPAVRLFVREGVTDVVVSALEAGDLDLGVISTRGGEPWCTDELVLVAAPGVNVDADRGPFVTFPRGATSRELLDRHFPRAQIVMEIASIAAAKANVRAGMGIALVSRRAVERDLAQGAMVEVPHPATPVVRPLTLVHRGVDRLPPAAAALRELLFELRPAHTPRGRRRPADGQKRAR